uniref:Uncharacterized protein n=1 Tax=Trichinella nativa TaxID=6335 RepID=A0A0V1KHH7_9BILA
MDGSRKYPEQGLWNTYDRTHGPHEAQEEGRPKSGCFSPS